MPARTARETFLVLPARAEFEKMAESAAFEVAIQYALLVMAEEQNEYSDPNQAWGEHRALMGARKLTRILRALHLKPETPKEFVTEQLKPIPHKKPQRI